MPSVLQRPRRSQGSPNRPVTLQARGAAARPCSTAAALRAGSGARRARCSCCHAHQTSCLLAHHRHCSASWLSTARRRRRRSACTTPTPPATRTQAAEAAAVFVWQRRWLALPGSTARTPVNAPVFARCIMKMEACRATRCTTACCTLLCCCSHSVNAARASTRQRLTDRRAQAAGSDAAADVLPAEGGGRRDRPALHAIGWRCSGGTQPRLPHTRFSRQGSACAAQVRGVSWRGLRDTGGARTG